MDLSHAKMPTVNGNGTDSDADKEKTLANSKQFSATSLQQESCYVTEVVDNSGDDCGGEIRIIPSVQGAYGLKRRASSLSFSVPLKRMVIEN